MFFKKKEKTKEMGEDVLVCPRCNVNMKKLKRESIIIDVCHKCNGMWLDDGEIEKLAVMARKGGKDEQKRT
ncbi:zf-TFIIB domain-containing protein [Candidatus Woesearchaeota archaeon]|nr:zf-TFIIB domain-containing protein [Candidatus Woesearchaeota archaeon]